MPNLAAIILAAGKGERLQPYSAYYQKCILPVEGKPLLAHWLDAINSQSQFMQINVLCGYKSSQVIDIINTWEQILFKANPYQLKLRSIGTEYAIPTDTVWKDIIFFCDKRKYLKLNPLLLCLGDNYSPNLTQIVSEMLKFQNTLSDSLQGVIGLISQNQCSGLNQGAVLNQEGIDGLREIREYRYNTTDGVGMDSFAWAGIGLFSPDVLNIREPNTMPELLALLAQKGKLAGYIIKQDYFDIGTPEGYDKVNH